LTEVDQWTLAQGRQLPLYKFTADDGLRRGFPAYGLGRGFDGANDVSDQIAEAVLDPPAVDMHRPA
jgi:hypothetical protein